MKTENFVRKEVLDLEEKEYAPKKEELKDRCDLSLNINPCGVSPRVLEKLKNIDPKRINHYYPENTELLNEIAKYTSVEKSQIMLGDGCDGCLGMIANTFINENDKIIIPVPTFHRYEFHTRIMGGMPIFIPMKNFELNNEILNSDNAKIIFLCNPNNPTGKQIKKRVLEEVIKKFRGIVVIDEALADTTNINGFEFLNKYNNLIIVRSFSKTFGLASLRIGYIISNQEIINQIKKTSSPFKVNGIAQELAIEALKDKEYIKKSTDHINRNRDFLINNLKKLGLKCTESVTTNFLVDVSNICENSKDFVDTLKKRGVLVTDATIFNVPENIYVRIAVATDEENKKFIEVLNEIKFSSNR
ncbi:MAG: histidinol-phosphate transaminase [Nanoarchaeota archaeon]